MYPRHNTPLAWKNLTHRPLRLGVSLAGVSFAVVLMFVETGFQHALLDSTVQLIEKLNADLIIVNRAQTAMPARRQFPRRRLHQARGTPGVAAVHPVYLETYASKLRRPGQKAYPIRVVAFEPGRGVFRDAEVQRQEPLLSDPRAILVDAKSKAKYGLWRDSNWFELAGRRVQVVGQFELGTDFANDGNLIMTAENFAAYFPHRAGVEDPLSVVDFGVVQVAAGANVESVRDRLRAALPQDVAVFTKDEVVAAERDFWNRSTPIGYIFAAGTILGFIVGVIICYQVIYSYIADSMSEFATLRAVGYPNRYFVALVIRKGLYLAVLGFIPGVLMTFLVFQVLSASTGLLMKFTLWRVTFILLLTAAMCVTSGLLALRKLVSADPAELF